MFIVSNFISASATLIGYVLTLYMWLIIIRALLSWVNPDPDNPIVQILYRLTEPALYAVRRRMPDIGGLDLSPIIILIAIMFLQSFLVRSLYDIANLMR
ncbi:MAG: YggT family protein [Nitrospinaceae bacterium]|nr:YggT family protein [Nitrospinaceae bacterium]MBT3820152.1 YggT family protein [Nitrospinaceae bacterium]MBT4093107.1 YggT family protein [Nitrospinaceae bacterium]MBT4429369.1 YggT family protein [Nitrospinaceae bacterium]MBT5367564.1 YggT family protein [Nitrospinaceae bacterium]